MRVFTSLGELKSYHELVKEKRLNPERSMIFSDFIEKATRLTNNKMVTSEIRTVLLYKAIEENEFEKLNFTNDFPDFLENDHFLLKFYQELSTELVSIENIPTESTYDAYEEQLVILKMIRERYVNLLNEFGYIDRIILPDVYNLNKEWLVKSIKKLEIYYIGYITNFELKVLQEISEIIPVQIHYTTSKYTTKMEKRFESLFGELEDNRHYLFDLSNKKVIYNKEFNFDKSVRVNASSINLSQIAFMKKEIESYITEGIPAENIAIILADSELLPIIKMYDKYENYHYLMDSKFGLTKEYKILEAIYSYFNEKTEENRNRINRYIESNELPQVVFDYISTLFNKEVEFDKAFDVINRLSIIIKDDYLLSIYKDEVSEFYHLKETFSPEKFSKYYNLFLRRLYDIEIDEPGNGKIKVMDALMSKGYFFEAVIVLSFNDDKVPLNSVKDMFLSSEVRNLISLPTKHDRYMMQRNMWFNLFARTKHISISYLDNELSNKSRFLNEFKYINEIKMDENELLSLLFDSNDTISFDGFNHDLEMEVDLTKEIWSNSKLKTYIECKRSWYFKYKLGIPSDIIDINIKRRANIGNMLHNVLKRVYDNFESIRNRDDLYFKLKTELKNEPQEDIYYKAEVDLWIKRIWKFVKNEESVLEVQVPYELEKKYNAEINGIMFKGIIDRIDKVFTKDDKELYRVIDYKSGKPKLYTQKTVSNASDFQMEIYSELLSAQKMNVIGYYFYSLKDAELIEEEQFNAKKELLYSYIDILKEKNQNFSQTDDISKCRNCPYKIICQK
jgi:ATP-dependent helicase/nuclease subunit B